MTAEERLRDLLRSEATTIVPGGEGLARIRARIERRRRLRTWLVPSAVLATAGAAAAFFLLTPDDRRTATLQPGQTPTATATEEPSPAATTTMAPVPADDGGIPLDRPAIWPFTTQAQASSWVDDHGSVPWAENGLEVGRHFVADYLGLKEVHVAQTCVSCDVLHLDVNGRSVGEITLGRIGAGFASGQGTHVYTVLAVGGTDLTVTTPKAGAGITSPTSVTGRITGVDEHVQLRLLSTEGRELATGGAQAGSAVPWSATLTWSRTDWSAGAIVGVTRSMKDGSVNRVVAVPVTRSDTSSTASFAAIADGHVNLYSTTDGAKLKQLTYPARGRVDTDATWSSGTLAWVRTAGASACVNELDRLDGSKASTVASSTSVRYGWPQLSPSAGRLAWVESPCDGTGPEKLVSSVNGTEGQRITGPSGSVMNLFDVADDGALLILTNDRQASGPGVIGILPAGATTLDGIAPLTPASGCNLYSGAAFDSKGVVAFEVCGSDVRLVHFARSGTRTSTGPGQHGEPPDSISVRDDVLLVWLFGGDRYGDIAVVRDGHTTTLIANSGCSSISDLKGCVRDPDW
jgi:hypothetical protein